MNAVLAMFRYNPQLGTYCVVNEVPVLRQSKTQIVIGFYGTEKKFNIDGTEKKPSKAVYGTATYHLYMDLNEVKSLFNGETFNGYHISTGKEYLNKVCNG